MKRTLLASAIVFSLAVALSASERREADLDRIQTASTVLSQIMSAPDNAIPDSIMSGAKCIAIVPSTLKASFVFGASYGKGVATCRTATGWSAPAFFKVTSGSFGFQAGGQASDLVLIIRTDEGMQHLLQSKFKLGADASAAAGPVGRDAQAMTDLTMRAQVLTYSRARGLFLGVSLGGGVIKQDDADTQAFYGKTWTYWSLLKGQVPAPTDASVLLQTVEKYAPTPKARPAPMASAAPVTAPAAPTETAAAQSAAMPAPAPRAQPSETAETEDGPAAAPAAAPAETVTPAQTPVAAAPAPGSGGEQ
jgi:SH3 domain-containing YSC84-like protein 1